MTLPELPGRVRISTRGSELALRQTHIVANALRAHWPALTVEITMINTAGDRNKSDAIPTLGDGVFVRGVEAALLDGSAEIAVHSAKDIPSTEAAELVLAAFPPRADPRDVLVARDGVGFDALPRGARLGTGSPRRAAIARHLRPDLNVALIRGNVDTRLRKLSDGEYDAIILAAAGLERLGLLPRVSEYLDPAVWIPAPGQGVLAAQCRSGSAVQQLLAPLDDAATRAAITAERAVLRELGSGCRTPVGAHARLEGGELVLRGALLTPDGARAEYAERRARAASAEQLGTELARGLIARAGFFERDAAPDAAGKPVR